MIICIGIAQNYYIKLVKGIKIFFLGNSSNSSYDQLKQHIYTNDYSDITIYQVDSDGKNSAARTDYRSILPFGICQRLLNVDLKKDIHLWAKSKTKIIFTDANRMDRIKIKDKEDLFAASETFGNNKFSDASFEATYHC